MVDSFSKVGKKYPTLWIDVRKRYHLSLAHIYTATELGLNPKKFDSLDNTEQESWKLPLPESIEELYIRHFKKSRSEDICTIEQRVNDETKKYERVKSADRWKMKQINRAREKLRNSGGS